MSQALRKLPGTIKRTNCLVIFINQIRMKIGVMFGNPETTTGGNALKFYASVRLDIRRIGSIKKNDEVIGNETRVKVKSSIWAWPPRSLKKPVRGTAITANASVRARTMRANSCARIRTSLVKSKIAYANRWGLLPCRRVRVPLPSPPLRLSVKLPSMLKTTSSRLSKFASPSHA